ncbi:gas vesicle protein [Nonomuraea wenchangensis]|uniref:Gas vesicle protein n=1 Tax=Nonomuraea wenchangensis TaxID=568860 RepID=A0A1I0LE80_9ACTN|nr:gas vesicle protein [Nonomuraea wenchangensis]SEU38410.1 Gas vesicle protein [Nonomuraea wenchangensis]
MTDWPARGVSADEIILSDRLPAERVSLVDLLDRLLAGGVVLSGDIILSIADIDLVCISLRTVLASADTLEDA